MQAKPPTDSTFAIQGQSEVCGQCQSVSRLTNGLCLNCLLRDALAEDATPSDKESFKEVLAAVKPRDSEWHIADHEILHEIARGGMGVVYQAREPHSGRIVALKCVLAYQGDADHVVARFRREAETAARLEHPNIVPIFQVGETAEGAPFYTMKYAAAGSLLQARQPLLHHSRQSAALMVKVARAVHYAHQQGVLHRDLKPGNILLDNHGEPLVSDFGLARCEAVSSYLTRSLSSFGTPGYVAPEQADGPAARLTPAADVYSLGAILFELLTGRTPFVGDNAFAVMKRSAEQRAPKVRTLAANVDRDLEIICDRCLEREPADRYQTAGELADDLQNWLDDRPIRARAPSVWRQTQRWVRRNRALAAAFAALCLLGVGSILWEIRAQRIQTAMRESVVAGRSLVVLPFLDMDTVAEAEATTEQVVNSLRNELQRIGPSRVLRGGLPGWSKLSDVRKAVRDAKGRAILTGTVRNVQGKQRTSLRLLDPATGQVLLAKLIEENQTERTRGIDQILGRKIYEILTTDNWSALTNSRADPGLRNEEAAVTIESGRAWLKNYTVADLDHAIALFRRAAEMEPNSALAHSYLAMAATTRIHLVADLKYLEEGRREALKALALEPDSAETHRALAGVYLQEGKLHEALEEQMRAIEIGGTGDRLTIFVGMTLDTLGRPDRALQWLQISSRQQIQPGEMEAPMGDCWAKLANDAQAFVNYDRAIELQPSSSEGAVAKARLHLLRGEDEAARDICRNRFLNHNELGEMAQIAAQIEFFARQFGPAEELYAKLAKGDPEGGGSFYGAISFQSALGRIRQELRTGDAAELLQRSLKMEQDAFRRQPANAESAYRLAAVEASLNLSETALQHLHQAVALGWLDYRSLRRDPRFDSVRSHPEFDTLIDGLSAKVAELRSKNKIGIK
ncbi:MAG: eukaryotic-like serine/threonine-protein kinase [Verrucomicrobiota bacterium]